MKYQFRSDVVGTIFLLFCTTIATAQNITEKNWLFGNSEEYLVFDKSGINVVLEDDQAVPFGTGGSAVISDQYTGDLIFYSDGQFVYDTYHNLLPGLAGDSLSGNPDFNQAAVTCPVPGTDTEYYIFTNSDTAIHYTMVDASLPGHGTVAQFPLGDISGSLNNSMNLPNQSEGMIIIEAGDGINYWLITQNRTSYEFHITSITDSGFSTRDTTLFSGTLPGFEVNQFAFNADSLELALAPKNRNRNILILDFDPATGDIDVNRSVRRSGVVDEIYDVEWSNDGSKLYFSVLGDSTDAGGVYQVDFADTVNTDPFLVNDILPYNFHRSYGLQKGIDRRMYHLYQINEGGPFRLGRFNQIDSVFDLVFYDSLVFDSDFNATQFPSCAPAQLEQLTVSFDWLDSCQGQATQFFPSVDPEPNNYFWVFGDGTASPASAPLKTYDNPGSYNVTLIAELNGRFGSFQQMVSIIAADSADLGEDTTICVDDPPLTLDPGVTGIEYVWNTGETTSTIDVDTAGTYWVNVTLATGCTTYDDIVVTEYGFSQQIGSQWYFGDRSALDFTGGAPVPIYDDNLMDSPEGCASVSDINGELIFYTNGSTVWNKEHDIMQNGTLIGGDSTAVQSALIIPFSDDATMFYIFTTEEVYGDDVFQLKYSIVDIKEDTARGAVVKKGVPLINRSSERVAGSGFTDPYILAHEFGNNNFRVYNISELGISSARHSSIGEPHRKESALNQRGQMKFSPLGTDLAVLIPGDSNLLEIFDFDFISGTISNPRLIDLEEPAPAEAYGLEYSGNSQKLYVSFTDPDTKVAQYSLDSLYRPNAASDIQNTRNEITGGAAVGLNGFGSLQRGPDGVIYLAIDNSDQLGTIANPSADMPTLDLSSFSLDSGSAGRVSRLGLPNFAQSGGTAQDTSMSITVACVGQETVFSGTGRDNSIEFYRWDFGDGNTTAFSQSPDTTHIYSDPGTYEVLLILQNRCDEDDTLRQTIEAFSIPEQPTVPGDTALCGGIVTLEAWSQDDPTLSYYWSTGQTTRTVTFTEPTVVNVAIINEDGCSSDTIQVFIGDGANSVDIGDDLTLCQNEPGPILDANNIGPDFVWTRDSTVIGEERTQQVSTSRQGTFVYAVAVTNRFTGCVGRDSITVTILPEPGVSQVNPISPDCGESNGSFQIEFTEGGSYSYELTGPVNQGPFTFDGPGTTPPLENLSSGTYQLIATNTVSGCSNTEVMLLEDIAPFEMEAISKNGCFKQGEIRVVLRNFVGSRVDVSIADSEGDIVYEEFSRSASNILINDLDTGIYYVSARQLVDPMCLQTDTVRLIQELKCFRTIVAPNAFTPGPGEGDGLNDEFYVFPNDYINAFEIFIYNRWGQIVYTSKDANFRWDGEFQNQPAPPGTYAYKMVFTSTLEPDIGEIVQYGSVTLIR